VFACIPALNEASAIGSVILQARKYVDRVFVCDDGSIDLTGGEFNVLCCDCAFYAHIPVVMASGGKGTSNVTGSICPTEFAELSKPWENYDDVLRTRRHLYRLLPLIRMMYCESNPVPLKYALNMLGAQVGKPRPPLTELAESNVATLRQTMQRLGILSEDSYQISFFKRK
jgi:dihydrodipicolinate synthase/N-acetylneuraminate lyase